VSEPVSFALPFTQGEVLALALLAVPAGAALVCCGMWLARGAPLGCAACFGGKAAPQAGGDEEEAGAERAPSFVPGQNMSAPRPAPRARANGARAWGGAPPRQGRACTRPRAPAPKGLSPFPPARARRGPGAEARVCEVPNRKAARFSWEPAPGGAADAAAPEPPMAEADAEALFLDACPGRRAASSPETVRPRRARLPPASILVQRTLSSGRYRSSLSERGVRCGT
jgi:hypothetical protein